MKILYLYEEVMGYTMSTICALAEQGHVIHIVHWDHKKLTPFVIQPLPGVNFYPRSLLTNPQILHLASGISPDLTVVSGWNDKGYLSVAYHLRMQSLFVILALDGQWKASPKQNIAKLLAKFNFFKLFYSHAWVAGVRQYEYARILGFERGQIVFDLYSADLKLFHGAYNTSFDQKQTLYPHRFIFVGRLEPAKGILTLLKAWSILDENKKDWKLDLIGSGSLSCSLQSSTSVCIHGFMQPEMLIREVSQSGFFVLPSNDEPWGVVVHEFAAAGVPLLLSDSVGAATSFLIPGLNGYLFKTGDACALAGIMFKIIQLSDHDLLRMSELSYQLSNRVTPLSSAGNLLSVFNPNHV